MPVSAAHPSSRRRRLQRRAVPLAALAGLAFTGGAVVGAAHVPGEQRVAERFATAWQRADYGAMLALLTPGSRPGPDAASLAAAYRAAAAVATATSYTIGRPRPAGHGAYALPVTARTQAFGEVRGTVVLPLQGAGERARVAWAPHLTFPGIPPGAELERSTALPARAALLARDNTVLAEGASRAPGPEGAAIAGSIVGQLGPIPPEEADAYRAAGYPDDAQVGISGLERVFERRLAGTPGGELRAGAVVLARRRPLPADPVRTTLAPSVQQAAVDALAGRLGGAIAFEPRTGQVLGVAGIAFSGLQPPGSTFKMVTLAAALQDGVATPRSRYPLAGSATLSGVELGNANGEVCGGTLVEAFAISCNSVFGPLGARLGGRRLVAMAERFGFNREPPITGAATSTIPPPEEIGDDLALGATAIGQGRVQATTLQMAMVAATFAVGGRLPRPTLAYEPGDRPRLGSRVVSAKVARQARRMMVEVVRAGTGRAAAIEGVTVAGKTGTAELRTTQPCTASPSATPGSCSGEVDAGDPSDTTAWFAAFAPAEAPRAVVTVMLVANGAGGDTAAPAARELLRAALRRG